MVRKLFTQLHKFRSLGTRNTLHRPDGRRWSHRQDYRRRRWQRRRHISFSGIEKSHSTFCCTVRSYSRRICLSGSIYSMPHEESKTFCFISTFLFVTTKYSGCNINAKDPVQLIKSCRICSRALHFLSTVYAFMSNAICLVPSQPYIPLAHTIWTLYTFSSNQINMRMRNEFRRAVSCAQPIEYQWRSTYSIFQQ